MSSNNWMARAIIYQVVRFHFFQTYCFCFNFPFFNILTSSILLPYFLLNLEHLLGHIIFNRNGFSRRIALHLVGSDNLHHGQMQKACELLRLLLHSFLILSNEEAVIHQITPLLTIIKLPEGNIGTKGSSHLVWQKSKPSPDSA